ncbi:hypothetical protein Nepgr_016942 [Nepenthes gracilis]|uniref:Uncharacterized protein n=1 Tax=Nepenthes gracilis TaxID=150966 RepID=A0AAD3SR65_NEPGR|nr:hypothetical protein Nepgr_016942 [Nepenthes gracilis]
MALRLEKQMANDTVVKYEGFASRIEGNNSHEIINNVGPLQKASDTTAVDPKHEGGGNVDEDVVEGN